MKSILVALIVLLACVAGYLSWRLADERRGRANDPPSAVAARKKAPAKTASAAAKPKTFVGPRPRVLAFKTNMAARTFVRTDDVVVREVTDGEWETYQNDRRRFVPPDPAAVEFQCLSRNVKVNEPLLHAFFDDSGRIPVWDRRPQLVALRFSPEEARTLGEIVLTTTVCANPDCTDVKTATGCILRNYEGGWSRMGKDRHDVYLLATSAHRAALFEHARSLGQINFRKREPRTPPPEEWYLNRDWGPDIERLAEEISQVRALETLLGGRFPKQPTLNKSRD